MDENLSPPSQAHAGRTKREFPRDPGEPESQDLLDLEHRDLAVGHRLLLPQPSMGRGRVGVSPGDHAGRGGGKGFEKPQPRGGEGSEKNLRKGSLPFENRQQGRLAEAEALFKQTIDIKRRALGDEHLETLKSMSDLANVYSSQGRIAEAHALYLKTLEGQRRVLGLDHTHTLITMNNLGLSFLKQKHYAEAESILRETFERDR